jgi:HAD superfamily hydrolase (TIGR01509 family)
VLHRPGQADRLWCAVLPGVDEALARFRALGLELVVVSNADGSVERSLGNLGLRHHFAHVLDSAVVGFAKPDPRIFREGLARAGAAPERTLHVGDLVHADVTGARGAGLPAALLDPYGDWSGVDCPVFPDLSALAEALERHRAPQPGVRSGDGAG